jgi:hypothetical protein
MYRNALSTTQQSLRGEATPGSGRRLVSMYKANDWFCPQEHIHRRSS